MTELALHFGPREVLVAAAALFAIGAYGVLARRNILVVLMSLEIMLNAVAITLAVFARLVGGDAGHAGHAFILVGMAVAAAEASVGLAIAFAFYRRWRTVDTDAAEVLRG